MWKQLQGQQIEVQGGLSFLFHIVSDFNFFFLLLFPHKFPMIKLPQFGLYFYWGILQ